MKGIFGEIDDKQVIHLKKKKKKNKATDWISKNVITIKPTQKVNETDQTTLGIIFKSDLYLIFRH